MGGRLVRPLDPVVPLGPVTPLAPVVPLGPVTPLAPVVPLGPVTPLGPVDPLGPVTPLAPDAPLTPVTPLAPDAPLTPATELVIGALTVGFGTAADLTTGCTNISGATCSVNARIVMSPTVRTNSGFSAPPRSSGNPEQPCRVHR